MLTLLNYVKILLVGSNTKGKSIMVKKIPSGICMFSNINNIAELFTSPLLQQAQKLSFRKGDIVIDIDDVPMYLYYLIEGCIRIYRPSYDNDLIVHNIVAPNTFAEANFFKQLPSTGRLVAIENCVVLAISKKVFFDFIREQDLFIQFFINNVCTKLTVNQDKIASLTNSDNKIKLAKLIYMLSIDRNNKNNEVFITHDELANIIGIHRVTVSRNLAKLHEEGILVTNRNSIRILDMAKLLDLI